MSFYGEAKAISKQIKSKGLQKLKFFCQICEKQCRDANGFKCHLESASHQKQMAIVGEDPSRVIDNYSKEFDEKFSSLLAFRFKNKKILANIAYKEYIADKSHLHMNSTRWETLSGYCYWLQEQKRAAVEDGALGLYITYFAPSAMDAFKSLTSSGGKIKQLDDDAQEEMERRKAESIAAIRSSNNNDNGNNNNNINIINNNIASFDEREKVNITTTTTANAIKPTATSAKNSSKLASIFNNDDDDDDDDDGNNNNGNKIKSNLELVIAAEEANKKRKLALEMQNNVHNNNNNNNIKFFKRK